MDEGERHLRKAIELNPNYADARRRLGAHLRLKLRLEEAFSHLETAVRLDPLSPINLRQLAYTHGCVGRFEEAEKLLRKAIDLDAQAGGLHYNLAELYRLQGRGDEAGGYAFQDPQE